jgi:hypothetical protein
MEATAETNKFEKVSKGIQTYVTPFNALYFFPLVISAVLDFLSPFGNYLLIVAVLCIFLFVVFLFGYKFKIPKWITKSVIVYLFIASFVFCSSAFANISFRHQGGFLASHIPKIKTWQDAYLIDIKKDTESIIAKTDALDKKVDRTNFLLTQVMANMQGPLEKVLKDEIKSYDKLAKNQKDALVYFSSKVGTNGIKRYKKLLNSVDLYVANPTAENKKAIMDSTRYVVEINGKRIEDEKTKLYVMALFFEPETFDYLIGNNTAPQANSELLKLYNINSELAAQSQVSDPLGNFINDLSARGERYTEVVIIPQEQNASPKKTRRTGTNLYGI